MKKIFTLCAALTLASTAMANKYVNVNTTSAKSQSYDSQVLVQLPKALETGKMYNMTMKVKGNEAIAADAKVALGGLIEDTTSSNKDQWGNSADLQYINNYPLTTEWATIELGTSDGKFPYDRIILNVGALNGKMSIDDITIMEQGATEPYIFLDFEESYSAVTKRGYHDHVSVEGYDDAWDSVTNWGLKIVTTEAKSNNYDTQVIIQLPKAMEVGKNYKITMDVKGSVAIAADAKVALGGLVEDNISKNRDQWGNSADLQYINNYPLTTEWATVEVANTNGLFAYDRVILNIGGLNGEMMIDNFKISDDKGEVFQLFDFDNGIECASTRSWHSHLTISNAPSDAPAAGLNAVNASKETVIYNILGQRVTEAKGLVIINGKKTIIK